MPKHNFSNSVLLRDFTRPWGRKHNMTVAEVTNIIRTVNNLMADKLAKGIKFDLPQRMGTIELRKFTPYARFKDGKVENNYHINWVETLKYWKENPKAKEEKVLIKYLGEESYCFRYGKKVAVYNNKCFVRFRPAYTLKKKTVHNIINGEADAFPYQ